MNPCKKAFITTLPVSIGYLLIGTGFGMMLKNAGYGIGWAVLMSLTIYAGSMQYVGVSLITLPASVINTILTTFIVNARHLFYAISMLKKYRNMPHRAYLIFALTDETYAILVNERENDAQLCFLVSFFNHLYWIFGSALGSILAGSVHFDTSWITFSMTALFISSYTDAFFDKKNRIPAVLGLIASLLCLILFGAEHFMPASMIAISVLLLSMEKMFKRRKNDES